MNSNIFSQVKFDSNINKSKKIKSLNLNFGPQHPAAHGVLRMILQMDHEVVERVDPHVGLLHRGTELLAEKKNFFHNIPHFDRLDYVSMLAQEHAYCLVLEDLMGLKKKNFLNNSVRIIFDELTRILNHMLAVACHGIDIGSMSSIFWAFEEREKIMEFYERMSGARMHAALYKPNNNIDSLISYSLIKDIIIFSKNCIKTLNEMNNILTFNKIWKQRLVNIGIINYRQSNSWGLSGVLLRSTGYRRDLRLDKKDTYSNYKNVIFNSYIGISGDSYDRYLIRMNEMFESINIINQSIFILSNYENSGNNSKKNKLLGDKIKWDTTTLNNLVSNNSLGSKRSYKTTMESVINDFKD
jgi:NADH:ubiquinone oxidoreductase subunit D